MESVHGREPATVPGKFRLNDKDSDPPRQFGAGKIEQAAQAEFRQWRQALGMQGIGATICTTKTASVRAISKDRDIADACP